MCGIVGFIGKTDAREIVLNGLTALEYRGYDSAGIALKNDGKIDIFKDIGNIEHLRSISKVSYVANLAIGHTRWATHGKPTKLNSHPHISQSGRFTVVHNGLIENFKSLKINKLTGFKFYSETDTEIIANLIEYYSNEGLPTDLAIRTAVSLLEGSYALLIIDNKDLDKIYFVKNKTPLLIGKGDDGITLASDTLALISTSKTWCYLEDKVLGYVTKNNVTAFDIAGNSIKLKFSKLTASHEIIEKNNFDHYMLKEIHEQPTVLRNIIERYFDDEDNILIDKTIINKIRKADHIYIAACGTSLHSAFIAKYYFEKLCKTPTDCLVASEIIYDMPLLSDNPFFIFVSQSGETADLISVIKKCKELKIPNLAITNSVYSTIDSLSDNVIHIHANKEVSVASTKAYVAQIATFAILARAVANNRTSLKENLSNLALAIESILENKELIKDVASKLINAENVFYIGRGLSYSACLESALKLKEIAYIHSECYPSGELKHGPMALIQNGTPVIAIIIEESTNANIRSNLIEAKTRGALGIVISTKSCSRNDDDIIVPDVASYLTPAIAVVAAQLLAYYAAVLRGHNVDKPRNLAKSVTVE